MTTFHTICSNETIELVDESMCVFKKVLIVEDDDIVRFLNRSIIEDSGMSESIVEINNGNDALEYLLIDLAAPKNFPDIIFLDNSMPIMNGLEFLQLYNSLPNVKNVHTKIVMLSSSNQLEEIEKAKELGVIEYIVKPLTEEKLKDLFEKVLTQTNAPSL